MNFLSQHWMFVYTLKAVSSCFIASRCKSCEITRSLLGLQAAWLSTDHSQCLKRGNGEKGQWKLGKRWLKFHLCVHRASRQTSHHWLTGYDWNHGSDVLYYLSVLCCKRDGRQQDHCYAIQGSWDPEILSLFYQNTWVTCLNTSVFIFLPFQVTQLPCQKPAANCLAFSVNAKVCKREQCIIYTVVSISIQQSFI